MPRNETARIDVKKFNELRGSQTYESLVESSKKRGDKNAAFSARTIQRAVKGKAIQVQIIDMLGTLLKTTRENLMLSDIALLPDEPQPDRAPLIKFGPVAQATIEIAKFVDKAQIYRRIDGASNLFDSQHEFMELCRSLRACRPALDKLTEALPHFAGSDVFPQRVILRARLACTNASQEIVAFEIPQHEIVALADDQCVPSAIPIYYQWFPSPRVELESGASRYVDIAVAVFCEDRDVVGLRQKLGREDLDVDALFFLRSSEEIRDWLMAAASLDRGFPLQFNVWFADGVTRPVTVQLQTLKVPECLTKNWIYSGAAFEAALREVHEWGDPFYYLNARMSLLRSLWHGDKRRPPSRGPERWEALRRILALVEKHRPAVGQTHGSLASAACNDIGAEAPAVLVHGAVLAGAFLEGGAPDTTIELLNAAAAGNFILILPECILDEMEQQLRSTTRLAPVMVTMYRRELAILNGLTGTSIPPILRPPFSSEADFMVDLGVAARVDYIITTDPELLHLNFDDDPVIADPTGFLAILKESSH